jgi:hypothetical protein
VFTQQQASVLALLLHGAMDDDDGRDRGYSRVLANANRQLLVAIRETTQRRKRVTS